MIWRILKWSLILVVVGVAVVTGYSFLGDFSAPGQPTETAVTINVD